MVSECLQASKLVGKFLKSLKTTTKNIAIQQASQPACSCLSVRRMMHLSGPDGAIERLFAYVCAVGVWPDGASGWEALPWSVP